MVTQPHPWREAERNPPGRTRYAYGCVGRRTGRPPLWSRLVGRPLSALPGYLPVKAQILGSRLMNPVSGIRTRLPAAAEGSRERSRDGSAGWDRLPAGVALRYIGVIARRIGAIVPGLAGVRLAVVVVAIIRIRAPPRIIIIRPRQSGTGQPPAVASAVPAMVPVPPMPAGEAVVQAREAAVKPAPMEPVGVKSTAVETAAVETAAVKPAAVETPPPPWNPPPPPCAAWARSGWQRTAAPSNAAAMPITRHLFWAGLRYCLIRASLTPLHLAAPGTLTTQPAFHERICVADASGANYS